MILDSGLLFLGHPVYRRPPMSKAAEKSPTCVCLSAAIYRDVSCLRLLLTH